ncbi:MAG TPA: acetate/propionate family kinase [Burkholderiales bacterium]|nr:acetate/propionate family kinase [Burkholderiales bacterium]
MSDALVVLNAGSSSIKFALFSREATCLLRGLVDGLGANPKFAAWDADGSALVTQPLPPAADHAAAIALALDWIETNDQGLALLGAGHRVVHGGDRYAQPVIVDEEVLRALDALVPLAPLHQPHNLAAIRAVAAQRRGLPQVACFDTEFHQTQPELARLFPLPKTFADAGIKRYGFHGLSYEYVARRLPGVIGDRAQGRVVVAHLGNGASLCAMQARRSIATTMGFTALDGLMMGTRSGSIDPGVLLYLMDELTMSSREVARLLYHESGLLGVSGVSHDVRTLLASSNPRARLALDLFVYRIARELGSLAAALGGLDALVFTAGIGEHAAPVRAAVCEQARWLGVELDPKANLANGPIISAPGSRVTVSVVPTDEEEMIARHALQALQIG